MQIISTCRFNFSGASASLSISGRLPSTLRTCAIMLISRAVLVWWALHCSCLLVSSARADRARYSRSITVDDPYSIYDESHASSTKMIASRIFQVVKLSTQSICCGSCLYLGFSFAKRLLSRKPQREDGLLANAYVPLRMHNDSDARIVQIKSDVDEVWNAILGIHNKQKELEERLEKQNASASDDLTVSQSPSDVDQLLEQLETSTASLRDRFDDVELVTAKLQSKLTSLQDDIDFQVKLRVSEELASISQRIEALEAEKKADHTKIVQRIDQLKRLVVDTLREQSSQSNET